MGELGVDIPVAMGLSIAYCESHLAGALHIAESLGDRPSQAELLGRLAIVATNRLQLDVALDLGIRAVTVARAAGDERALATGLDGLKIAYLSLGDAARFGEVLAELEPLVRRHGDLFRTQWAEFESAFLPFAAADWDGAEARIQAAILTNHRSGYPASVAWYTAHLGLIARLRGRDTEAIAIGRRALAIADQQGRSWWTATAAATLASALVLTGAREEATGLLERGLATAQQDGAEAYLLRCLAPLAAVTGSLELLTEADRLLAQAASNAGAWIPGYEAYLALARAWVGRGEPERARALLAPLLTVAQRAPWTPVLAESLAVDGSALATLGRSAEASAALHEAAQLAAGHGMPHVRADAEAALGTLR